MTAHDEARPRPVRRHLTLRCHFLGKNHLFHPKMTPQRRLGARESLGLVAVRVILLPVPVVAHHRGNIALRRPPKIR